MTKSKYNYQEFHNKVMGDMLTSRSIIEEESRCKAYPRLEEIILEKNDKVLNSNKTSTKEISKVKLGTILYYAAGIKKNLKRSYGSLIGYPLEVYVVSLSSSEIQDGVYHYYPKNNSLELLLDFDLDQIKKILGTDRGYSIIITSVFNKNENVSTNYGYYESLIEAGNLAQNFFTLSRVIYINCRVLDIKNEVNLEKIIDIDGTRESILCVLQIGES